MPETGNPNVRTNYKGKYEVIGADNATHVIMLSNANDVIFCDNFVSSNNNLCTLPSDLSPDSLIRFNCLCSDNTVSRVAVYADGSLNAQHNGKTYQLKGMSFNISGKYYA